MKTKFLFPNHFRKIGWFIFVPAAVLGILLLFDKNLPFSDLLEVKVFALFSTSTNFTDQEFSKVIENNIFDELLGVALLISLLFISFSKEKIEDEFIRQIRLDSLVWATIVNSLLLFLSLIFLYDFAFLNFMIINMFSVFFLFILRFNWAMTRSKKMLPV